MAAKSVTRALQKAYQNPSLLFPFLNQQQQQGLSALQQKAGKTLDVSSSRFACSPFPDKTSQHSWIPLGFPPHTDAENRHVPFVFFDKLSPYTTLSPHCDRQLCNKMQRLGLKPSLLLSREESQLQDAAHLSPEKLWKFTNSSYFPPSSELDEVVLPSQNEDTSPMLMSTKRTFNPSTIVRKRRHGFLARKATVGGRRVLARRFAKGRRRLSA